MSLIVTGARPSLGGFAPHFPEDWLTLPMADFYLRKAFFFWCPHFAGTIHPAELSSLGSTSVCSLSLLHWSPQTEHSRFIPMSAQQGEFLRCAGKFCLIQPMDLHPCQGALQHLLETTWNRRKTLSPELCSAQLVGKCKISPSQGLEFASGWGSGWPGLPRRAALPSCLCHVELCGNLLRDILPPWPQLDISTQFILPLTPAMLELKIILDVSKWMHVQNEEMVKSCLES